MMRTMSVLTLLAVLVVAGCESRGGSALLGGAAGAAVGAGTYEYRMKQARDSVEADYKAGKMDQREYEIRMDQINRVALIK